MAIDRNKVERAAVRAVEEYIDDCPQLEPVLQSNDKTPIWDGEIYVYDKKRHKVEDFSAIVHLQIKGSAALKGSFYRIDRAHVEAYKADRGCVFLMHQQREGLSKLLYAILPVKEIEALLQQKTKTIKIDLKEVPVDPLDFQKELIAFAEERNGKRIENTSPKEIESLIKHFKDIKQHLDEVEDNGIKIELESFLNTILGLRNDGTVGWRDKFIYLARKVLDLALQHVKGYDALGLQFELAYYLQKQKLYHLVEDYYLQALAVYRERAKAIPFYKEHVAATLNNLAVLHDELNQFDAAEKEYKEALEIRRKLAKVNPDAYLPNMATTLNNLAVLHNNLNQFEEAEKEYKEALEIRRKVANDNPDAYLYIVAATLNNIAILHKNLNQFDAAEKEFKEALKIRRKLAKDNPDAYLGDVATTLNNLACLHKNLNQFDAAEKEYNEALDIYRKLVKDNPDAYLGDVAVTLFNIALLMIQDGEQEEAKQVCQESLDLFKAMAKKAPQRFNKDVDKAQLLLNLLNMLDDINEL